MSDNPDNQDVEVVGKEGHLLGHADNDQVRPVIASRSLTLLALVSLIACFSIYLIRLDRVFGAFVDDAWYAVLA